MRTFFLLSEEGVANKALCTTAAAVTVVAACANTFVEDVRFEPLLRAEFFAVLTGAQRSYGEAVLPITCSVV